MKKGTKFLSLALAACLAVGTQPVLADTIMCSCTLKCTNEFDGEKSVCDLCTPDWTACAYGSYTLSFDANGGSGVMEEITGISGEYSLPNCTFTPPSDKIFQHWSLSSDNCTDPLMAGDMYNVTTSSMLYAIWQDAPSGGGGGSYVPPTTSTTEQNPDGSITTTVTNNATGTVTEITERPDGSTETVETKKDGTVTTTIEAVDGSVTTTVKTPDGGMSAESAVSDKAGEAIVADAVESGTTEVVIAPEIPSDASKTEVSIPASIVGSIGSETNAALTISTSVADVSIPNGGLGDLANVGGQVTVAAEKTGNAVALTITTGNETITNLSGGITMTVPHEDTVPGTVAVLIKEAGTREIIRKSVSEDNQVTIPLSGSVRVELVDNSKAFNDTDNHWASNAIDFVTARELFNGNTRGEIVPDGTMTRGMLARVLHNLENNPGHSFEGSFSDLGGHWATESIYWAAEYGIIGGYPDGSCGADNDISREQLAVMLWRYAGSPTSNHDLGHFNDAGDISSYALQALSWLNEQGIMNGRGAGILDPTGEATRAEVATMLMRIM